MRAIPSHPLVLVRSVRASLITLGIYALLGVTASVNAAVYFVSPCGQDAWIGVSSVCSGPLGPKRTIQAALAVASDGDEIRVLPGAYVGPIDFDGKAVHLRGLGGAAVTSISGPGIGTVLLCNSLEGPDTVIEGFTITGGNAASGGGMIAALSSPTVIDCVFTNNSAGLTGGAVALTAASPLFIGCSFVGNSAPVAGGAIVISFGSPDFDTCTFASNASADGGGLRATDSQVTLEGCHFTDNSAASLGGGLLVSGGTLSASDTTFELNQAEFGGGLFANEDAECSLIGCAVRENDASASQGGIGAESATLQLLGTVVELNQAVTVAGLGTYQSVIHALGCTFAENMAGFAGGGVAIGESSADDALFELCSFNGNLGAVGGGAVLLIEGGATFEACTFFDNSATSGGAIADLTDTIPSLARLEGCTFANNTALNSGGAIFLGLLTSLHATRCNFELNEANGTDGGAILKYGASMRLVSCEFIGNTADGAGGGVFSSAITTLANCVLAGNSAGGNGGGLFLSTSAGASSVRQCTIVNNSAVGDGDGLHAVGAHPVSVGNSILWSNGLPQVSGGAATFSHSVVPVGVAGAGCISTNPKFVSAPTGNYRLLASSPAIDAGLIWLLPEDHADLDGDGDVEELLSRDLDEAVRVRTASAGAATCGLAVDMGAYESALGLPAQPAMLGDLDGSGSVGAPDLAILLGEWGATGGCPLADLNGDGTVDASDLAVLLGAWE